MARQIQTSSQIRVSKYYHTRLKPVFPVAAFSCIFLVLFLIIFTFVPKWVGIEMMGKIPFSSAFSFMPLRAVNILTIDSAGVRYLNQRAMVLSDLSLALNELTKTGMNPTLLIRADARLQYHVIKETIDLAWNSGLSDVRLEVSRSITDSVGKSDRSTNNHNSGVK